MVFGWKKKSEPEAERPASSITLQEARKILGEEEKRRAAELVSQVARLRAPVSEHVAALLRIATDLEKDPLKTDDVDVNIATIVKRGKRQVLDAINKESGRALPEPATPEDAKEFHRVASMILKRIGDILGKQTRVIHIFAKKYAGQLKDILARFSEDVGQSGRLLAGYAEFERERDRLASLMDGLDSAMKTAESCDQKAAHMAETISEKEAEAARLGEEISRFEASENHSRYLETCARLDGLHEEKARLQSEINSQTMSISRPVSKYGYGSALDKDGKAVVAKLLDSPLEVFVPERRAAVQEVLANIKKAVSLGHLSVKEPEKTVGHIDEISAKVDGFVASVSSVGEQEAELERQLESLGHAELVGMQKSLEKTQKDIEFARSRRAELEREANAARDARPGQLAQLGSGLGALCGARYEVHDA